MDLDGFGTQLRMRLFRHVQSTEHNSDVDNVGCWLRRDANFLKIYAVSKVHGLGVRDNQMQLHVTPIPREEWRFKQCHWTILDLGPCSLPCQPPFFATIRLVHVGWKVFWQDNDDFFFDSQVGPRYTMYHYMYHYVLVSSPFVNELPGMPCWRQDGSCQTVVSVFSMCFKAVPHGVFQFVSLCSRLFCLNPQLPGCAFVLF